MEKCFGKKFYGRNKSLFPNEKGNKPQYPSQFTGNFFKKRWERVYFYGAGCANLDKKNILEASLVAQFKTPISAESDLLAAARGLLIDKPGIACILGTGSNSCLYDGERIIKNVRSAGYILGDEGSGAAMGRRFLSDYLKNLTPKDLCDAFMKIQSYSGRDYGLHI